MSYSITPSVIKTTQKGLLVEPVFSALEMKFADYRQMQDGTVEETPNPYYIENAAMTFSSGSIFEILNELNAAQPDDLPCHFMFDDIHPLISTYMDTYGPAPQMRTGATVGPMPPDWLHNIIERLDKMIQLGRARGATCISIA